MNNNIAYIYQPHFNTNCFRAAVLKQQGKKYNYIIVTCSPEYNGVWKYNADNVLNYDVWSNNNKECYCVPIRDCRRIKLLNELTNIEVINKVKFQQKKWYNNTVKNRDYTYTDKPEWML